MKNSARSIGLLVLLCLAAWATAGPPFNTDDPVPVDFHHWEVYFASIYSHDRGLISGTFPHVEVNYGAAPNLQLHIIAPAAFSDQIGAPKMYGYGDTELGAKYRIVQETASVPMIGVFPLVEVPTGDQNKGLGTGHTRVFLPVWLQKDWGSWSSYFGGGYWINPGPGNQNYTFLGVQLQNQVTKQLAIGGEVFRVSPPNPGGSFETGFDFGAIYDFDDCHHFMFSVGRDMQGTVGLAAYVAFQWTFGPHEAHPS